MRLIDADNLKEVISWSEVCRLSKDEIKKIIDGEPTVKTDKYYIQGFNDGVKLVLEIMKGGINNAEQ